MGALIVLIAFILILFGIPLLTLLLKHLRTSNAELVVKKLREEGLIPPPGPAPNQENDITVTDDGEGGRAAQTVRHLARDILAPVLNTNIRIFHCKGLSRFPITDDTNTFHIFVYSSPEGKAEFDPPKRAWKCRVKKRKGSKIFAPSSLGLPVVDAAGFVGAELLLRNLYIHYDFANEGSYEGAMLLARLLIAARNELATFETLTVEALEERLQNQFCQQCGKQFSRPRRNENTAEERTAGPDQAQSELITHMKQLMGSQKEYLCLSRQAADRFGREFDTLRANEKVDDIIIERGYLVAHTKVLFCRDPRTNLRHEIGRFEIKLPLHGDAEDIRWINKDRRVDTGEWTMNAPHVNASGYACLGNTETAFNQLLFNKEYVAALEAAIAFVESVNVDDNWGRTITEWPTASEQ